MERHAHRGGSGETPTLAVHAPTGEACFLCTSIEARVRQLSGFQKSSVDKHNDLEEGFGGFQGHGQRNWNTVKAGTPFRGGV